MSVIPLIPRKSEDTLSIIDSSRLSTFQVTYWDIKVIIVLWVLFFVTSIFVILRLYSRVKILQFYAAEDYLYNIAFVSLSFPFLFCSFIARAHLCVPTFRFWYHCSSTPSRNLHWSPTLKSPAILRRSEPVQASQAPKLQKLDSLSSLT